MTTINYYITRHHRNHHYHRRHLKEPQDVGYYGLQVIEEKSRK